MGIKVSVHPLKNVYIFFKNVLFFLRLYVGFKIEFQGGVRSQITPQGPSNYYLGYNKGDWVLVCSKKNVYIFVNNVCGVPNLFSGWGKVANHSLRSPK